MEDLVTELENARRENSELAGLLKKKKAECVEHAKREKEGMREKEEEVEALRREVGRVEAEERKRRKGLEAEVGRLGEGVAELEIENRKLQEVNERLRRENGVMRNTIAEYQTREGENTTVTTTTTNPPMIRRNFEL